MDTNLDLVLLAIFYVPAVLCFCLCAYGLKEESQARRRGMAPRPGLRAGTDWAGTIGIGFTILALTLSALIAAGQEGLWRILPAVFINLLMQPLCILLIACGLYTAGQALRGRAVYAMRAIPREKISVCEYRRLLTDRVRSGLIAVTFGCGLSYVCVRTLL